MERFPVTLAGFEDIEKELKNLKTVQRPAIIQAISEARELGDLSENAEYQTARERQSFIEGRILDLEDKIARADVIDVTKLTGKIVKFGATVVIIDEESEKEVQYKIVGETESNVEEGKISFTSPIAKALIGREEGDSVEVKTPSGTKSYEILEVKFI